MENHPERLIDELNKTIIYQNAKIQELERRLFNKEPSRNRYCTSIDVMEHSESGNKWVIYGEHYDNIDDAISKLIEIKNMIKTETIKYCGV